MPRKKRESFNVREKERASTLRRKKTWTRRETKVRWKGKKRCV
jgi:hypothetical protein